MCRVHFATLLAPGVVHGDAPLRTLHEDHEYDCCDTADEHEDGRCRRHFAISDQLGRTSDRRRHAGNDTGENDHRNAIADTTFRDLLAEPHQEHRARDQRDTRGDQEARTRIDDETGLVLQPRRGSDRLEAREANRSPACVFDNHATTLLAFLTQLLQARYDMTRHLHNNRR